MANVLTRFSAAVSSLVDTVFGRRRLVDIRRSRVEGIYGPPDMLRQRAAGTQGAETPAPKPEPEPVDLYGPPVAGEEEPDEVCVSEQDPSPEPETDEQARQNSPVCVYGPPPSLSSPHTDCI